jgi:hypothetical protein
VSNVTHIPQLEPFENGISEAEVMRRIRAAGGMTTDGVVDPETMTGPAWGKTCFVGRLVHRWTRVGEPQHMITKHHGAIAGYGLQSACGLFTVVDCVRPLLGGGNFPRCKKLRRRR